MNATVQGNITGRNLIMDYTAPGELTLPLHSLAAARRLERTWNACCLWSPPDPRRQCARTLPHCRRRLPRRAGGAQRPHGQVSTEGGAARPCAVDRGHAHIGPWCANCYTMRSVLPARAAGTSPRVAWVRTAVGGPPRVSRSCQHLSNHRIIHRPRVPPPLPQTMVAASSPRGRRAASWLPSRWPLTAPSGERSGRAVWCTL